MSEEISMTEDIPTFEHIIELAAQDTDEAWEQIDQVLADYRTEANIAWALSSGLLNTSDGIRDLAASLIEDCPDVGSFMEEVLTEHLISESSLVVKYRLAAGKYKRGDRGEVVMGVITKAQQSDDKMLADAADELMAA